jgi:deazaflavin-dependent oxidoreductase (nitroreductase family)
MGTSSKKKGHGRPSLHRDNFESSADDVAMSTGGGSGPQAKPGWRERALTATSLAFFRVFGPLVRRAIHRGIAGPNVLVTVRGRRSGLPRTTPVAMLELGDVRYLQASFGDVGWVRNLRASGEARVTRGRWSETCTATELPPETAGAMMRTTLAPFHRSRLVAAILGPTIRPPIAVLYRYRIRIDDTPEEYVAEARRHPLFELQSKAAATTS